MRVAGVRAARATGKKRRKENVTECDAFWTAPNIAITLACWLCAFMHRLFFCCPVGSISHPLLCVGLIVPCAPLLCASNHGLVPPLLFRVLVSNALHLQVHAFAVYNVWLILSTRACRSVLQSQWEFINQEFVTLSFFLYEVKHGEIPSLHPFVRGHPWIAQQWIETWQKILEVHCTV